MLAYDPSSATREDSRVLRDRIGVPPRLIGPLLLGVPLNPLNSSMIAVALVPMQRHFEVSVATASWLVSGFYLAASVGQPLMGRLIDQFGARRLYVAGLTIMLAASAAAPFAPSFWWVVAMRAVQALGTSTAFPSALVLIRRTAGGETPAGALGALAITASSCAALGPVIGGALVGFAGWQAVFWVNVPITAIGIVVVLAFLPPARPEPDRDRPTFWQRLDPAGVLLFGAAQISLLIMLLSFAGHPRLWLLAVVAALGGLLVYREMRARSPFLDVRGLVGNRALTSVLVQQILLNLVYYCVFYGLPLWLQAVRGYGSQLAGLIMLPIAAVGALVTPFAATLIKRRGSKLPLVIGSIVLLAGTALIQLFGDATPIAVMIVLGLVLGLPNGLNNLGLQTALYAAAPPERTGSAGGLFQTCRYLGAILSTSVLGVVFERNLTSTGFHHVGYVMAGGAAVLVALSLLLRRVPDEATRS